MIQYIYNFRTHALAISISELGAIGETTLNKLMHSTRKSQRKAAFNTLKKLLTLGGILASDWEIYSITAGSDRNGQDVLNVIYFSEDDYHA